MRKTTWTGLFHLNWKMKLSLRFVLTFMHFKYERTQSMGEKGITPSTITKWSASALCSSYLPVLDTCMFQCKCVLYECFLNCLLLNAIFFTACTVFVLTNNEAKPICCHILKQWNQTFIVQTSWITLTWTRLNVWLKHADRRDLICLI